MGQPKLAVVDHLAVGKQIRPKFWYSNKEGLLCGENELSFSSQADSMRGWDFSVRYLGQIWELKQEGGLHVFGKNSLSAGPGLFPHLTLMLVKNTSEMLKDGETAAYLCQSSLPL